MRVLEVDDNRDTVDSVAKLLRHDGHEVQSAYTGPVALQLAEAYPPDAVLSDICMPGMDGYEVAKRLRQKFQERVLLIAVTALSSHEDPGRSHQAGFDHHLVKPVDPHELRALLAGAPDTG